MARPDTVFLGVKIAMFRVCVITKSQFFLLSEVKKVPKTSVQSFQSFINSSSKNLGKNQLFFSAARHRSIEAETPLSFNEEDAEKGTRALPTWASIKRAFGQPKTSVGNYQILYVIFFLN